MSTKLIAAELATVAGITTVIINSLCPQDILPIIEASEDVPDDNDRTEEQAAQEGYGLPKCTRFIRQPTRLNECVVPWSVPTLADLMTLFQSKMVGSSRPALCRFGCVSSLPSKGRLPYSCHIHRRQDRRRRPSCHTPQRVRRSSTAIGSRRSLRHLRRAPSSQALCQTAQKSDRTRRSKPGRSGG
jgi:hypothetical protein